MFKKDESDSHLFKSYKETIKANNKTIIIPKETMAKANEYVLVSSPIELVKVDVNESIFF